MTKSALFAAAFFVCFSIVSAGSNDGPNNNNNNNKGGKKAEASKEEKANAKLPPCAACTNLVASFDQVWQAKFIKNHYEQSQCKVSLSYFHNSPIIIRDSLFDKVLQIQLIVHFLLPSQWGSNSAMTPQSSFINKSDRFCYETSQF